MSDLLLSEGATIKAKEADHFAFLISDVIIPDGTPCLDAAASLAGAGIYTTEDDLVYGMDESDSRNERMVIKAVGRLGVSNHRWNEGALSQLDATAKTVSNGRGGISIRRSNSAVAIAQPIRKFTPRVEIWIAIEILTTNTA